MRTTLLCVVFCLSSWAQIFGGVRGVVHDTQHRPIAGVRVVLVSARSQAAQVALTTANGEFSFPRVLLGDYTITASQTGFAPRSERLTVLAGTSPVVHLELPVATQAQETTVTAAPESANLQTAAATTMVGRTTIAQTPGADRANSMAMITDFTPGAYMVHDQLHLRGGHQVSWEVDGVPVPNTNIASNVGPQFDPKDVDDLEVQRGGYDASFGDRTYGVFNVVPKSGFDSNRQAELVMSGGNFGQTNDQFNFASHTDTFAYYGSLNANRSDYGLQTPDSPILHDAENGFGGFTSLIDNLDPSDQLRLVVAARRDFYQIPNTPEQQAAGMRDVQRESDAFANFSWVRTINPNTLLTVSPFYHFNSANYVGGPNDYPSSTTDLRGSSYVGAQVSLNAEVGAQTIETGAYGFAQSDNQEFGLRFNDGSAPSFTDQQPVSGQLEEVFLEDKYQPWTALTLMGGVRASHFSGALAENAADPRLGAAYRVPRLGWVLRAYFGDYYQAPPLITASGPLLQYVTGQSLGFIPLRGERDQEYQFGLTIPLRGWFLEGDAFHTRANNFFDHNNVGNSDIFFPLTIAQARIVGFESTLRSPRVWNRGEFHLAYSNQIAEGAGAVTGGLTDFSPPTGYFLLDHDQRNTLSTGFTADLPHRAYWSSNVYYGSGFTNGSGTGPAHLPGHASVDMSLGDPIRENLTLDLNALNLFNRRLLVDNSFTFGGTHFNDPREIYLELRYKFKY